MRKRIVIEITTKRGKRRIIPVEIIAKRKAGIVDRLVRKYGLVPVRTA